MEFELQWEKEIPIEQIKAFEDKTIYNMAVYTREYTKSAMAFPYLTGRLQQSEIATPIIKLDQCNYGLATGVDYATKVWNYKGVNWTNPSTQPQWYMSVLKASVDVIVMNAVQTALKEV